MSLNLNGLVQMPLGKSMCLKPLTHLCSVSLIVLSASCSGNSQSDTPQPEAAMPVIERLDPTSGQTGEAYPIRLTIHGRGFDAAGNVVKFGPVEIADLPSTNGGTQIATFVPKTMPSRGEAPPFVLTPGEYAVTVTTQDGTSVSVTFTLVD